MMINSREELKTVLSLEKRNYKLPKFWRMLVFFRASEQSLIWYYQMCLRKYEFHLNKKHRFRKMLFRFKTNRIGIRYGILIPPNVFGKGLKIMHLGSIVVNSAAKIGDNCSIGTGAIIVGNVTLKNNVAVGAGAVVTKSFLDNCITIAGVPAKIISNNHII